MRRIGVITLAVCAIATPFINDTQTVAQQLSDPQRIVDVGSEVPQADPLNAFAYYDAATGDILLSIGEGLFFVAITDAPFAELSGTFDPSLVKTYTGLGAPATVTSESIAWITDDFLNEALPSGVFNIGRLLPADYRLTSGEAFDDLYPDAILAANGVGIQRPYLTQFRVIQASLAIPEPGSVAFFTLATILCTISRRRRRN
jgi:hypothetical protein